MIHLILAILLMALATLITRAFPFLLFARKKPPQKLLQAARLIPGAVMLVLVFTSLPMDLLSLEQQDFLTWISVAFVALLHLLFRQPLLSILGGTALYMGLLHWYFPQ